jgi:hypothetical protein
MVTDSELEGILQQLEAGLRVEQPVWIEPNLRCVSFSPAGYLSLTSLSVGLTAPILTFQVPDGFNGVIYDIANTCNSPSFQDGSGQLVWAIQVDGNYGHNLEAMTAQRGTVEKPTHLSSPLFVREGQVVSLLVTNVSLTVSSGPVIGGLLGGWFYPADEEPLQTWVSTGPLSFAVPGPGGDYVQSYQPISPDTPTSPATVTLTLPNPVTVGNSLIVLVYAMAFPDIAVSVALSDSLGNSFSPQGSALGDQFIQGSGYLAPVTAGGTDTITVGINWTEGTPTGWCVYAGEYRGTLAFDTQAHAFTFFNNTSATASVDAAGPDLILATGFASSSFPPSMTLLTPGYTSRQVSTTPNGQFVLQNLDQITTEAGTVSATFQFGNLIGTNASGEIFLWAWSVSMVTSVGLSVPPEFSVSGSPVTTDGTLAMTKVNQPANVVWAGPASGLAGAPSFRALTAGDLPSSGGPSTTPLAIGFIITIGTTGTDVGPILLAPRAGTLSKCVIVTKVSDPSTALTIKVKQNGTDVFSIDPTVAAGTASGTVNTFTALASSPLSVAANDVFTLDITSGTATWQATVQLET